MSELDVNRLLLQFEKSVREINRNEINPRIPELKLIDLNPVILMVAHARARYLKELFDMASVSGGESPAGTETVAGQRLLGVWRSGRGKCVAL